MHTSYQRKIRSDLTGYLKTSPLLLLTYQHQGGGAGFHMASPNDCAQQSRTECIINVVIGDFIRGRYNFGHAGLNGLVESSL